MIKKRKRLVFRISYVIILLIVSVMAFIWYSNVLKNELRGLVRNTLKEVSNQNVLVVQKEIEGDLAALEEIAERIGALEDIRGAEITEMLKDIAERYSFKTMGYSDLNGKAYTAEGGLLDISEKEFFDVSIQGTTFISEPLLDSYDAEPIIVFSAPVKRDTQIIGVVYIMYQVESLKEVLAVTSFGGEGYTYIVQQDGNKVVDSINATSFQNMTNIFTSMKEADKRNNRAVEELKNLLDSRETGYVIFYNEIGKYMYVTPLGINDWFLIDVVPVDFMDSTSNYIIHRTYLICAILTAVIAVIAVMIYREERKKKQQIQNLLFVDELTGGNTLAKFKRDAVWNLENRYGDCAFVMMDLHDFKLINELFGYDEGDRVLRYLYEVLQRNCQERECMGRSIADLFVMQLYYETKEGLEERVKMIKKEIQEYSMPGASEYILHPAIGIYYAKRNDEDMEDILGCATLAHNLAKQEKGISYKVYTDAIKEKMLQKKQLSDQIEHACKNHEFVAYYQPKYEAETKRLAGAEALVRWKKPDGQMIPPGIFIPLAEESGFVRKLDEYMFKEVCRAQKRWLEKGLEIVPISVNLSRRHLENPQFIDKYKKIVDESGVPIEYIQLEITESAMFEKTDEFIDIMERLHELGFVILMDDFGTGYSSLMMLKSVPIDVMKLDKSFVDDYDDERGEQIIRCVMRMAQELQIAITAEGVETEDQYRFLKSIGCDTIQGYYFAKPMPEEEYERCMNKTSA